MDDDTERVPDGKPCRGGIDAYRVLDPARDDFPPTAAAPSATGSSAAPSW
ncbi:hypothetical protein [Actinoplanes sp. NPDC049802]